MSLSAKDLPICRRCPLPPTQSVTPDSLDRLDAAGLALLQPEIERIGKDGVSHVVAIDDIVAIYSIPDQLCSYLKHPHTHGVVIRSRCGLLLQIGMDCGSHSVIGFDQVAHQIKAVTAVDLERALGDDAQALSDRLELLLAKIARRRDSLGALRRELPLVHKAMSDARATNNNEVHVRKTRYDSVQGREISEYIRHELKGLQLFPGMEIAGPQALLERVKKYVSARHSTYTDKNNAKNFGRERVSLNKRVDSLAEFVREADQFWTPSNLELALYKTFGESCPAYVTVKGSTIVVGREQVCVIGADGPIQQ